MRLSDFIRKNTPIIIAEWETFAKTLTPAADSMSDLQLKDHISQLLEFIAKDIQTAQTPIEQITKSQGGSDNTHAQKDTAAETHGELRHASGFNMVQMVSEYRALRSSVIKLWSHENDTWTATDILDLTRFNEAIDQTLAESVLRFMEKVDYSKDLLLGVLGHDIRSPLGAIKMLAHLMPVVGALTQKQNDLLAQINNCSLRVDSIVADLLDMTQARIGAGLSVVRRPIHIDMIAKEIMAEIQVLFPKRTIVLESSGDVAGEWDPTRLGQVFSNLISNAVQYSPEAMPVSVAINGETEGVSIAVHNGGKPIPPARLATLFDSFIRGDVEDNGTGMVNLGLGLFITREIILSHQGHLNVTSSDKAGTVFTVWLPRIDVAHEAKS
jgi:signal transduction histidine kinase